MAKLCNKSSDEHLAASLEYEINLLVTKAKTMFEFTYVVFYANGEIKTQSDEDWIITTRLASTADSSAIERQIISSANITYASRNDETSPINAIVMSYFLNRSVTFEPGRPVKFSFAQSGAISHGISVFYLKNPPTDHNIELKSLFFPGDNYNQNNLDGWSMRSIHNKYYIRRNCSNNITPGANPNKRKQSTESELIFIVYPKGPMSTSVKWKLIRPNEVFNITPKKISSELRYLHVIYFSN